MKRFLSRLLIILFLLAVGWAFGYLRLPYIEKDHSFWVGFLGGLAFVAFVFTLLRIWNKNKSNETEKVGNSRLIWVIIFSVILIGGWVSGIIFYRQSKKFKAEYQRQHSMIQEQGAVIDSIRSANIGARMDNVLENAANELKNNSSDTLSAATIVQVADLSYSFKPYQYNKGDSLSRKKLSPERGQLLLALATMKIDSGSFAKLKRNTTFSGADLRGANLKGADLSGIDLKDADLSRADLSGANLSQADLRSVNFWGANLSGANLSKANVRRSDLSWAVISNADLHKAFLNSGNLTNAQLINADLRGVDFDWSTLDGVMFNGANITGGDLHGTSMKKANFINANLTEVDLKGVDLSHAILTGAELTHAKVDKDWFDKLREWKIDGAKEIRKNYKIVDVTTEKEDTPKFRLEKAED